MIHSVRIEASGDDPGHVRRELHDAVGRLGLGIGDIADEHYDRDGYGYKGRLKVAYIVPMGAERERAYDAETQAILKGINERYMAEQGTEMVVGAVSDMRTDASGPLYFPPSGLEDWRAEKREDLRIRIEEPGDPQDRPRPTSFS